MVAIRRRQQIRRQASPIAGLVAAAATLAMLWPSGVAAQEYCEQIADLARQTRALYDEGHDPYHLEAYLNYETQYSFCLQGIASSNTVGPYKPAPYDDGAVLQRIIGTMGNVIDILDAFEDLLENPDRDPGPPPGAPAADPTAQQQAWLQHRELLRQQAEAERQRLIKLRAGAIADPCSEPGNPFCSGSTASNPFGPADDNPFE